MQVGCGRSVRRAADHARGLEGHRTRVRGPCPHLRGPFPKGHPRTRLLSPCKKTSAQRGRGGRAVIHGPLANPRVLPSPERVRGGPAPAATAGVRRPAWRGSLRPAALPGNRVRREGRGSRSPLVPWEACTLPRRGPCGPEAGARVGPTGRSLWAGLRA